MRRGRTAMLLLAVGCACAGGPALADAVSHTPRAGAADTAATQTAPINTVTLTSTATTTTATATTTTATQTSTATTTTTTTTPAFQVCLTSVRRLLARRLGVRAAGISEHQFLASNGMPQCNYVIARAHRGGPRGKVVLTVNVDNGPQPHWRLMRKVVEASQLFGPAPKGWKAPTAVRGLGPYASWFWNLDQLMALNVGHEYILTVGVIWRHTTHIEKLGITRAVIVVYRHISRLPA